MLSIEDINKNKDLRLYIEALLLDKDVPPQVWQDLFGISKDIAMSYKEKFYPDADLPKLILFSKIKNIEDPFEKDLKLKVFKFGHEWVSTILNQSRHVDPLEVGLRITRSLISKLAFLANKDEIKPADFKMFKDVMKLIVDQQKIKPEDTTQDEIRIILKELSEEENSKISDLVEEFNNRLDSESEEVYNLIEKSKDGIENLKKKVQNNEK